MITIKNVTKEIEHIVKPTVFPDGTQQVWKLPEELLEAGDFEIIWHFETDAELVTLVQVATLIDILPKYDKSYSKKLSSRILIVPFLPYGRQDKLVSNDNTFGLTPFLHILHNLSFDKIVTYDIHSLKYNGYHLIPKDVNKQVSEALSLSLADIVCFPDKGASQRGYATHLVGCEDSPQPSFHLSKTRDQSTGKITGMKCDLPLDLKGKTVLLVDDICDGGRTFIEAAKVLKSMGAQSVQLYVTHGIFSQGVYVLTEGGIDHIYTTDSYKTKAKLTDKVTVIKLDL